MAVDPAGGTGCRCRSSGRRSDRRPHAFAIIDRSARGTRRHGTRSRCPRSFRHAASAVLLRDVGSSVPGVRSVVRASDRCRARRRCGPAEPACRGEAGNVRSIDVRCRSGRVDTVGRRGTAQNPGTGDKRPARPIRAGDHRTRDGDATADDAPACAEISGQSLAVRCVGRDGSVGRRVDTAQGTRTGPHAGLVRQARGPTRPGIPSTRRSIAAGAHALTSPRRIRPHPPGSGRDGLSQPLRARLS